MYSKSSLPSNLSQKCTKIAWRPGRARTSWVLKSAWLEPFSHSGRPGKEQSIIALAAVLDDLPLVEENRKGRAEIGRGKS